MRLVTVYGSPAPPGRLAAALAELASCVRGRVLGPVPLAARRAG